VARRGRVLVFVEVSAQHAGRAAESLQPVNSADCRGGSAWLGSTPTGRR